MHAKNAAEYGRASEASAEPVAEVVERACVWVAFSPVVSPKMVVLCV
jgi:hypothetical protein